MPCHVISVETQTNGGSLKLKDQNLVCTLSPEESRNRYNSKDLHCSRTSEVMSEVDIFGRTSADMSIPILKSICHVSQHYPGTKAPMATLTRYNLARK